MQVVEVRPAARFVIAVVPRQRRHVRVELVEEKMHGVQRPHQWCERARIIEKMLDRVHAEATPWTRVVALVVQRVGHAIQPSSHVAVHQSVLNVKPRVHNPDSKIARYL